MQLLAGSEFIEPIVATDVLKSFVIENTCSLVKRIGRNDLPNSQFDSIQDIEFMVWFFSQYFWEKNFITKIIMQFLFSSSVST